MAESEKFENLLQMALALSERERGADSNLNAGYNHENNTWELIIKYNGDIEELRTDVIQVEPLLFGYAIVTIPESLIEAFAKLEQVEFIEKPKLLFPQTAEGIRNSCIWEIQRQEPYLTGKGVLVGIIDSGIDYTMESFQTPDGKTRILSIYDEGLGRIFTREEIDAALESGERLPTFDVTGHGTAVTNIAAGRGGKNQGVAYESELIIVKLDTANQSSYPMTTSLLRAFYYLVTEAAKRNMPIAINLSFGNTYGAHDGRSLVERFMNNAAEYGKNVICVGSGNEGAAAGHMVGKFPNDFEAQTISFFVGGYETQLSVQLWKKYEDNYEIRLYSPGGESFLLPQQTNEAVTIKRNLEQTEIYVFMGKPQPYSMNQETYFYFRPADRYINEGIWQIELTPKRIVTGEYDLYLSGQSVRGTATRFLTPVPELTLTIPSTAERVITVGAYDTRYNSYADFSGRGYVSYTRRGDLEQIQDVKPDIVAPGVGIVTNNGRGEVSLSGTSFATPFVTGGAALMMEWAITDGNDPYLYGEKLKAYLIRGAKKLPGFATWPNPLVGWGALCVADSIPRG